jgi:hypothetical protein
VADLDFQPFAVVARGPVRDADPASYDVDGDKESEVFAIETASNSDGETVKRETKLKGDDRRRALMAAAFGADLAAEKLRIEQENG